MPVFQKCFCLEIETGAVVIGWIRLSFYGICLAFSTLLLMISFQVPCDSYCTVVCMFGDSGFTFISLFFVILFSIFFIITINLLQGLDEQDHMKILPSVLLSALEIMIGTTVLILYTKLEDLAYLLICWILAFYSFLILYSIYEKFKKQKMSDLDT